MKQMSRIDAASNVSLALGIVTNRRLELLLQLLLDSLGPSFLDLEMAVTEDLFHLSLVTKNPFIVTRTSRWS